MFTFIVLCCQQADVVPLALESVRFQIERYGQGREFQLIAADDGSTDGSQAVIRAWAEKHSGLFAKIDLLFSPENRGICQNYVDALRRVEGERFVKVDGDDLLAPGSVFELTDLLSDYDLVCTAFLRFTGHGKAVRGRGAYLEVVLQEYIRGGVLRLAAKLGCPVMGAAIFRKSLLTEEVFDFILRFRTVNDRACLQKLLTGGRALRVCYVNRPVILYRVSDSSVSSFQSPGRLLHSREIGLLCRAQREAETAPALRFLLLWQEKSAVFRAASSRLVRFLRFFSPYFALMLGLCIVRWPSIRRLERQLADGHWRECEAHWRRIAAELETTPGGTPAAREAARKNGVDTPEAGGYNSL